MTFRENRRELAGRRRDLLALIRQRNGGSGSWVASMIGFSNMRIVSNLCASDLFDRYPQAQVVSAESGIGWVMYILESPRVPALRDGHRAWTS